MAVVKEQRPGFYVPGFCRGPRAAWGALSSYCVLWLYQGLVPQSSSSHLQLWVRGQLSHWWDSCNPGPSWVQLGHCCLHSAKAPFPGMSQLASEDQPPPRFSPIRVCRTFLLTGPGGIQGREPSKSNAESEEQTLRGATASSAHRASVTPGCQGDAGWAPALMSR